MTTKVTMETTSILNVNMLTTRTLESLKLDVNNAGLTFTDQKQQVASSSTVHQDLNNNELIILLR